MVPVWSAFPGISMERRLAAILAVDVVGFSRLMEVDEAGTLAALKIRRKEVLRPLIAKHRGRIFKVAGDGVLVEFASAGNAVQCAVELQEGMAAANSDQPEERRIVLRIGVNLGDVIVEGSDLYGDGVNIAARLESIAEPGSILVSGTAHDHIRNKVQVGFDDLGTQNLKNIAEPVRIYRVAGTPAVAVVTPRVTAEKPAIAVLPFVNMSSDSEQEYFADGMTEDIITELSRFKSLLVIARNSSFYYKGRSPRIQDVGRELGVRWIVEGSVRKAGNWVRITAQLIDATTGAHVWAERYDRTLDSIFEVQDEVVQAIVGTIPGHLGRIAVEHARRRPPANLTAFDHLLRGRWALFHSTDGLQSALVHLEKAIEADPNYAAAHAQIATAFAYGIYALGLEPEIAIERACHHAARAVALDGGDTEVNAAAASAYITSGMHELADLHSARATASNPNNASALFSRGFVLAHLGRPSEAIEIFSQMQRIDPLAPDDARSEVLCDCHFMLGEYETVIGILRHRHDVPAYMHLIEAAAYAQLGRIEESKAAVAAFHRSPAPKPDPKTMIASQMRMIAHQEDRERWLEGYRKAGLPV
ncbi:MAG: hypothetical protein EOS07_17095 [Mesorhizobium sp.]|nr:MAG: hypothetical protein EOS07_17095 [Mesorhizobium sp.]